MLAQEKFAELDASAASERKEKSRNPGGGWKLHDTYQFLSAPAPADGVEASDADWQAHLAKLQRWVAARPGSITARVTLAEAYVYYAWFARGDEFADLVKHGNWDPFNQRMQTARDILEKASTLHDKCPEWYEVMEGVALGQGWDADERNALLEQAMKLEPLYYYVYQDHAHALQPRWYGEPGDPEKFADDIAARIGGKQGDAIYFEIAITLNCVGCSESKSYFKRLSWERIQKGYAIEEELYGTSYYKLNQFAHLTIRAEDRRAAVQAFLHIGDHWMKEVWKSRSYFEGSREWAMALPDDFIAAWKSAAGHYRESGGVAYAGQFQADFHTNFDSTVKKCTDAGKYDEGAFSLVFRLTKDGRVAQAIPSPATNVAQCLVPLVSAHRFATPPEDSYWVMLNVGESKPRPYFFQGATLPDIGR